MNGFFCFIHQDYISDLAQAVLNEEDEDFGLECLGILGNLTIPDLDYELILKEYNLIPWIKSRLEPGMCNDPITECLILNKNDVHVYHCSNDSCHHSISCIRSINF